MTVKYCFKRFISSRKYASFIDLFKRSQNVFDEPLKWWFYFQSILSCTKFDLKKKKIIISIVVSIFLIIDNVHLAVDLLLVGIFSLF